MSKAGRAAQTAGPEQDADVGAVDSELNEVRLVGRLSGDPRERVLPSGDRVVTIRMVIRRPVAHVSRQRVDVLDCAIWGAALQRSVLGWVDADVVEIEGAVRRRFFRQGERAASRVEVEVSAGRLRRRAEHE